MEEESADCIVIGWTGGRYSSDVWKSFDRIIVDGKLKAKCKHCGTTYVYAGTSSLKRHIAGRCPYRENVLLPIHLQQQQQIQLPKTEPVDPPMNSTVPPAHDNNGSVPLAHDNNGSVPPDRDNNGSPPIISAQGPADPPMKSTVSPARHNNGSWPITSAQGPADPPMNSTVPPARHNNCSPPITSAQASRIGEVKRVTKETNVHVKINLDGDAVAENNTGIPFLDHMLDQLASHGLFDVHVNATGDIHIDDHHTNEDIAVAIGTALLQALGDKKGINRFGDVSSPLSEALVHVSLDLSGRPHLNYGLSIPTQTVGNYDTQLVEHFFQSLVNTSGMTLHIRQLAGRNSHHIIEATFMAFARALRQATEYGPHRRGIVPSPDGVP